MIYLYNTKKGFTLVEIMVSLAIFSLVMVVALGAFLKIVDLNKRAQNVESAVNNLTFTMEALTRELRTGQSYSTATWPISFIGKYDSSNQPVYYAYRLDANRIQRATRTGSVPIAGDFSYTTSPSVKITTLSFELIPNTIPMVRIYTAGEVGSVEKAKATFDIQTTISQRLK